MLLAGDVGGTKTLLGLYTRGATRPQPIAVSAFVTLRYDGLASMIAEFLRQQAQEGFEVETAVIGVAGAVIDRAARLTNVPWRVTAAEVENGLPCRRVQLLNDLEAMAHAVPVLQADELVVLQTGVPVPTGNAALIAAGTGLGEALLHQVGGRFIPAASEGGHADFAARTPREIDLLRDLIARYGRAHVEHVVSGPGLLNVHRFLHPHGCAACELTGNAADGPANVSRAALEGRCAACVETLDLFVSAYGAEAGNLALRSVATAGVYVGGGIAPKILPALQAGRFIEAFRSKEPMVELLSRIPVSVIVNERAGLLGAAAYAAWLTANLR